MPTLFEKVWNAHAVRTLPSGQTQLFVGLHLVHEVTSPQAFDMLRQHGWTVAYPQRTFATVDHIVPTSSQKRPFIDLTAEEVAGLLVAGVGVLSHDTCTTHRTVPRFRIGDVTLPTSRVAGNGLAGSRVPSYSLDETKRFRFIRPPIGAPHVPPQAERSASCRR